MKATSTIDLRTRASRATTLDYLHTTADLFALAVKAGPKTLFIIINGNDLHQVLRGKTSRCAFKDNKDGLRWKGLMVNHLNQLGVNVREHIEIRKGWKTFEVGSNGTMSAAQEQAVCDALNAIGYKGKSWKVTANIHTNEGYDPDITSTDGKIKIEVKGFNGRMFRT